MINHWHEKGLFAYQKEPGKWREFSMVDYVWVLFVNRLRLLNIGLVSIAKIKEQCFASPYFLLEGYLANYAATAEPGPISAHLREAVVLLHDPETQQQLQAPETRLFSLWLLVAIQNNQDVLVRIQPNAANSTDFVLLSEAKTDTEQIVKTIAKTGGLFISLQALLNEFYGTERFTWENIQKLEIDQETRTILGIIRQKGLNEVTITLREDKVTHLQATTAPKKMSATAFANAIASKKYVDCRVVKNEGDELLVSITQNFKLSEGRVKK
jgi:hypothetical protein